MNCAKCNAEIAENSKFCLECGAKVGTAELVCAGCGVKLLPAAKFCPECGTKVGTAELVCSGSDDNAATNLADEDKEVIQVETETVEEGEPKTRKLEVFNEMLTSSKEGRMVKAAIALVMAMGKVTERSLPKETLRANLTDSDLDPHKRRQILVVSEGIQHGLAADVPKYTVKKAMKLFQFPPNHPIPGAVYAMVDVVPDVYVPLVQFHDYVKNSKHEAFVNLCASLGAKEVHVQSVVINDRALDVNSDISHPLAEAGFSLNIKENSKDGTKIAMSFNQSNSQIRDVADSPWINIEPTWRSMIKGRKEYGLETFTVEFNHTDEMGVDAKLAAKFAEYGASIGGSYREMTRVKLTYEVVFWPVERG